MKRPLLCAFVFMIVGILAGQYLTNDVSIVLFFVLIMLVCLLLVLKYASKGHFIFLLFCGFGFLGIVNSNGFRHPYRSEINRLIQENVDVVMAGTVREVSYTKTERQKIVVQLMEVYPDYKNDEKKRLEVGIKLQAILEEDDEVFIGQRILFKGKIQALGKERNPGGFNEYQYLKARKILYKTFPVVLEKGEIVSTPRVWISDLKNQLAHVYDVCLPPREAGIIKAMIIGDKATLEFDIRTLYWDAGIVHILSISGLHISMIALALQMLLGVRFNTKTSGIITLMFLIFYCFLAGASVSTVRAVVMCGVIIIGRVIYRDRDLLTSTAFAGVCLLCYEPLYLFDIGFQYSFAAVFGLGLGAEPFERGLILLTTRFPKGFGYLKHPFIQNALPASLGAHFATWPITAYYFYYVFPYNIFVNILILPSVFLVTLFGFCIGVLGLISLNVGIFFSGFLFTVLKIYEVTCLFFVSLPFAKILIGREPLINLLVWYVLLGMVIYFLHGKMEEGQGNGFIARGKYVGIGVGMYVLCSAWYHLGPKAFQMTMLDVGQGDCMVIHDNQYAFVIDGGGLHNKELGSNTGETVLKPFLEYNNIDRIDAVFLTHFDSDHAAGIIELMNIKGEKIGRIFIPDVVGEDSSLYDLLISTAETYKIPIEPLNAGDSVETPAYVFQCLHPFAASENTSSENVGGNESSLVVKLQYKNAAFLFTGDIGKEEEEKILASGADLSADILKVAHHGSKNSSSDEFLAAVSPRIAIIGSGVHNIYGHPHKETLALLERQAVMVYNTAWNGAILIGAPGNKIEIKTMLGADENETADE